ncbi:peptidoglycan-associated lipoprotein Pal [Ideonella sp. 4Y16]|uniref:Peptidoglycan-associated protein n=1 Tax=Ideonella alba TaxID=2824118 RepID=A0A940YEY5_9BURK|nr:peptidoglycan-associated lipoprotein Pal [Ideonella alba]MBQ0932948.1 peptidoglycan-associated lipoprotein Pal [Ideonella alba]MBQ0942645.1 peptidoglycan-associated lipoprotein Pal [Ideonella alba]
MIPSATPRRSRPLLWSAALAASLLAGCASSVKLDNDVPVESRNPNAAAQGGSGAGAGGTAQSNVATVDLTAQDKAGTVGRVVYFDFDSFVIKDEYRSVVEGQAKLLQANRQRLVQIEGHTDERGGREYNLALGQKRAEAVQRALVLLGVSDKQLEAVSYGEERPADPGHDEAAWAKNRRAEVKDR